MEGDPLQTLGQWVRARRQALRMSQADVSARSGLGEATIRRIERGETAELRPKTKSELERVLAVKTGLIDRIIDGTATEDEQDPAAPTRQEPRMSDVSNTELVTRTIDRITRFGRTPSIEEAIQALFRAMPDIHRLEAQAREPVDD